MESTLKPAVVPVLIGTVLLTLQRCLVFPRRTWGPLIPYLNTMPYHSHYRDALESSLDNLTPRFVTAATEINGKWAVVWQGCYLSVILIPGVWQGGQEMTHSLSQILCVTDLQLYLFPQEPQLLAHNKWSSGDFLSLLWESWIFDLTN